MMHENEAKLTYRYPSLFKTEDGCPFHFECDDGWFDVIDECAKKLVLAAPDIVAAQVKEKFGGLRFYVEFDTGTSDPAMVYAIISEAKERAWRTCELCGLAGQPTGRYWVKTLCQEHASKWKQ